MELPNIELHFNHFALPGVYQVPLPMLQLSSSHYKSVINHFELLVIHAFHVLNVEVLFPFNLKFLYKFFLNDFFQEILDVMHLVVGIILQLVLKHDPYRWVTCSAF